MIFYYLETFIYSKNTLINNRWWILRHLVAKELKTMVWVSVLSSLKKSKVGMTHSQILMDLAPPSGHIIENDGMSQCIIFLV